MVRPDLGKDEWRLPKTSGWNGLRVYSWRRSGGLWRQGSSDDGQRERVQRGIALSRTRRDSLCLLWEVEAEPVLLLRPFLKEILTSEVKRPAKTK